MTRVLRRLAPLLLVSLVSSACAVSGGGPGATTSDESPPTSSPVATTDVTDPGDDPTPAASGGDEVEPGSSGVLRLAMVGEPSWDPLKASPVDPAAMTVIDLLYDGLTRWEHPDSGDDGPGRWVPDLAETISSDDQRVWRIVLGDHRFSDGERVEAADVARSLLRLLRDGSTLGAARLADVTEIVGIGWNELRITLAAPDERFPARLSHPLFGIVPAGPVDGLVGSGPLVRSSQDPLRLERAGEGSADRGGGESVAAQIEAVEFVSFLDGVAAVDAVRAGRADLVHLAPSFPVAEVDLGNTEVLVRDSNARVVFALNAAAPDLGPVETRHRVVDAADSVALYAALVAEAAPVESSPPTDLAQIDELEGAGDSDASDEDRQSGAGDGVIEVAHVRDEPGGETAMAHELVEQLEAAGLEAVAVPYEFDDLVRLVAEGRHEAVRAGWVGLFPGDEGLPELLRSSSPDNITGVAEPFVDALVETTGSEWSAIVDELAVIVPVGAVEFRAVVADRVRGIILLRDGSLDLGAVTLAPY